MGRFRELCRFVFGIYSLHHCSFTSPRPLSLSLLWPNKRFQTSFQVVREGTTLPLNAGGSCKVKPEMREEVEDALLCLLPLTAHRQQGPLLNRALGLVATSPGHPGLDALLHLASAEGGTALQVRRRSSLPSCTCVFLSAPSLFLSLYLCLSLFLSPLSTSLLSLYLPLSTRFQA